jgi:hypothetical protein
MRQKRLVERFVAGSTARTVAALIGVNKSTTSYNSHLLHQLTDIRTAQRNQARLVTDPAVLAERWRVHYNTVRPHSSLGYRSPAPAAWRTQAPQGHGKVESKELFPLSHTPNYGDGAYPSPRYTNNLAGTKDRAGQDHQAVQCNQVAEWVVAFGKDLLMRTHRCLIHVAPTLSDVTEHRVFPV